MSNDIRASAEAFDRGLTKAARLSRSLAEARVATTALAVGRRRRSLADVPGPPPRPRVRAGRNDPCPCGSGKKFKRCCLVVD